MSMFKELVEAIKLEASQRGSLFNLKARRTSGMSKVVKSGSNRFLRHNAKQEIDKAKKDDDYETNIPRRGIKGWAD